MRVFAELLNATDPGVDTVFDGYTVLCAYLVVDRTRPERAWIEQTQQIDLLGNVNQFQLDLPEDDALNLDGGLELRVLNHQGAEVWRKRFELAEVLRQRHAHKPLQIRLEVPRRDALQPLVVHGTLVFEGRPEVVTGFAGYRVSAAFRAQETLQAPHTPQSASVLLNDGNGFSFELPPTQRLLDIEIPIDVKYPSGEIARTASFTIVALAQPVVLIIAAPQTPVLTAAAGAQAELTQKLKGKVVDLRGAVQLGKRQVILWGRSAAGAQTPLLVATTDSAGNFSGKWPPDLLEAAAATVAGTGAAAQEAAVPLSLVDAAPPAQGRQLPKFVYIVVEAGPATDDDCECHDRDAPRQPDAEDLVLNSNAYSQDIGGGCVNFTVPNRTLEEFTYTLVVRTSEPEIKGTTVSDLEARDLRVHALKEAAMATPIAATGTTGATVPMIKALNPLEPIKAKAVSHYLKDVEISHALPPYFSDMFKTAPGRGVLDARNAVDWDATPTFYQATTIAHGHILYYKQVWKADGYSLGDLLYSLPLAPGQKKQVVVFDWDRTEYGRRDEDAHEDEALNAYLSHNRDIIDITRGSVNESTRGGSSSRTSGTSGGAGLGAVIPAGPVMIGVAGGFASSSGSASSSAWQDASRNVSASGLNQLRDMVEQGASAVRNQRSTVVQTARQNERFRVETEVVANHNHCHAITVQYFEVLRHYAIEQQLTHVQECLFIPLLMSQFDEPKTARWMDLLRPALRDPNPRAVFRLVTGGLSLRQKPLSDGFDAIERRVNRYEGSDVPATSYAAEPVLDLSGDLTITLALNRPKDSDDAAADNPIDAVLWAHYADFTGWTPFFIYNNYFAKRAQQERDRLFEEEIAPRIAEGFVNTLKFVAIDTGGNPHELHLDVTLISRYRRDLPLYCSVRPTQGAFGITREQIAKLVIYSNYDISDSANSRIIVRSGTFRYRTAHYEGVLYRNDAIDNDLKNRTIPVPIGSVTIPEDNVVLYTPLNAEELRNPREEDKELSKKLLRHLNASIEYYHRAIWGTMDADRRYMLLDGFVAPNSGGRSVASVVENRVIGVAGNSLIMPVAPGYKLDPSYEAKPRLVDGQPERDELGRIVFEPADLLGHYEPLTPIPPFRVSVPTRGVFAEAVMGACNSCEKKDETRFWRWEESPNPDEPTPINAVQTHPPQRSDPGDLAQTPFPTPMINIQNAPAAPEPGATLTGALGLLGKSDLFPNITGLEQTQKNALQAMLSTQESAKHFTDKAAELATLAANQRGGNTTIESIKKSMDDGSLDRETGKKLIEDVYRTQISGKPTQAPNTANTSKLGHAAADAVRSGRAVKATQTHPDGTQTMIEQAPSPPPLPGGTGAAGGAGLSELGSVLKSGVDDGLTTPQFAQESFEQGVGQLLQVDYREGGVPAMQSAALTARLFKDEQARREALSAEDIRKFTPKSEQTLVSYAFEYPAPEGLAVTNWARAGLDHYGTVIGNVKIGGDRNTNPTTPTAYPTRRLVRGIVLHETTNWSRVGAGVTQDHFATSVHFSVSPDGTVYQHNDIAQILDHATRANSYTVGIEVTNLSVFAKGAQGAPSEVPSGATDKLHSEQTGHAFAEDVADSCERIPAPWVSGVAGNLRYAFPAAPQMESVARLVHWLCGGTDRVPRAAYLDVHDAWTWRPFFTATLGGKLRELFMLHHNPRWTDAQYEDFEGILAHGNMDINRSDGCVIALYCWLRLHNKMAAVDAYALTRALVGDATLVKTNVPYLTHKVVALDVTGRVPGRGVPL